MMLLAVKRWRRWLWRLLAGVLGLGLVLLVLWAVVVVPPLLIDTHQIQDPAKRLDEINGLRTILAGVLGGLAVIVGAAVGFLNFRETSRQNRALLDLQRRGQVTERFTRAIEQLGQADKLDVRIGAVYALEQIARDSAELHWPIMEVLTAYLREHARVRSPDTSTAEAARATPGVEPAADLQAIATVIGRRRRSQDPPDQRLDLREVDLSRVLWDRAELEGAFLGWAQLERAGLPGAQLRRAFLGGTHLEGAYLRGADLDGADLSHAHLEGANLHEAQLKGAILRGTHLTGADLSWAQLEGAHLSGAWLERADLSAAQLERADFSGTRLEGAHLSGALMEGVQLSGADLTDVVGLTWPQLTAARNVDQAKLPGYLTKESQPDVRPAE